MKYSAFNTDFEVQPFLSTKKHIQPFYGFIVRDKKHHYFLTGSAVGLDEHDTAIRAFAEHIERKSFYYYMLKKNEIKDISYIDLNKIVEGVSPQEFIKNTDKMNWVIGRELTENKEMYLPAGVFIARSKVRVFPPDTTGTASHTSEEMAIYNAIQEIIERNALAQSFSLGLSGAIIDKDSLDNQEIKIILQELKQKQIDALIIDISTDFGISVYLSLFFSKSNIPQIFAVGAGSNADMMTAIKKSLFEAYHTYLIMRTIYKSDSYLQGIYKRISPISKRLSWWMEHQGILKEMYKELKSHNPQKLTIKKYNEMATAEGLVSLFKQRKLNVYAKSLKKPDKKNNLYVYKISIPQLSTLSLASEYPYLKNIVIDGKSKKSLLKNLLQQKKIILTDDFFTNHFFP